MQDRELYRRILGIEAPWYVESVDSKLERGEIHVHLRHHDMIHWPCPECGAAFRLYDHQPERQWRHLDTCHYQTILRAEPPRSECRDHGVKGKQSRPDGFWGTLTDEQINGIEAVAIQNSEGCGG